jgi:cyclohexanone monooxygenase
VLISIESEVEYIIKILSKFQKENLKSFVVRTDAVNDFNEWKDDFMKGTSKLSLSLVSFDIIS